MSDVFISYSRDDLDKVSQIAQAVQREGYDLWWDADLPPHRSYGDVIQEKIGGAKAVIVVWSEEATKSEWVRAEADMARNQQKLVQTSIDDGMPPLPFNQIQFASLSDWTGQRDHPAWRKVLVSLSDLVGAGAEPVPPSKTPDRPAAPEPEQVPAAQGKSQLPLILSLLSLVGVAGLLLWFFLGNNGGNSVSSEENDTRIAEAPKTEPVVQSAGPAKPEIGPAIPQPVSPADQTQSVNQFNESAVIEDADGWTNFRAGPSRSAAIVGRIEAGEVFNTHRQNGDWWKIRTNNGVEGYMHYSRISLTASRPSAPKMIFADSDRRLISTQELERLSKSELRIARNEIFARRGRIFNSADLRAYFSRFAWYRPTSANVAVNDIEKANAQAMKAEERRR